MEPQIQVLPPGQPQKKKSVFQNIGGGIAALVVAAAKFKFLIWGGLKTALSMFVMIGFYSLAFGWKFAVGFVFLLFVHEMGHVVAARILGMPVTAPLFIPFVGAYIVLKENPRDAWTEALMAYGGPLAGCVGSWICWGFATALQEPWLMAVASTSFVVNLFNMIPIPPLDGGRICSAVSRWFWLIGLILLGASLFYFHSVGSIFIIVIVLLAAFQRIRSTFSGYDTPEMQQYYATHISNRLTMALLYLGLIAALLLGYWHASGYLSSQWDQSGSSSYGGDSQ